MKLLQSCPSPRRPRLGRRRLGQVPVIVAVRALGLALVLFEAVSCWRLFRPPCLKLRSVFHALAPVGPERRELPRRPRLRT